MRSSEEVGSEVEKRKGDVRSGERKEVKEALGRKFYLGLWSVYEMHYCAPIPISEKHKDKQTYFSLGWFAEI